MQNSDSSLTTTNVVNKATNVVNMAAVVITPSAVISNPESYRKEPWFFGDISRDVSEELLKKAFPREDGMFLIRNSSQPLSFALSFLNNNFVEHALIKFSNQRYYINELDLGASLAELLQLCMVKELNVIPCQLTIPCPRPSQDNTIHNMVENLLNQSSNPLTTKCYLQKVARNEQVPLYNYVSHGILCYVMYVCIYFCVVFHVALNPSN